MGSNRQKGKLKGGINVSKCLYFRMSTLNDIRIDVYLCKWKRGKKNVFI